MSHESEQETPSRHPAVRSDRRTAVAGSHDHHQRRDHPASGEHGLEPAARARRRVGVGDHRLHQLAGRPRRGRRHHPRPAAVHPPADPDDRHGLGGERRRADLRRGAARAAVLPAQHPVPAPPALGWLGRHGQRHRHRGAGDPAHARPPQPDLRRARRVSRWSGSRRTPTGISGSAPRRRCGTAWSAGSSSTRPTWRAERAPARCSSCRWRWPRPSRRRPRPPAPTVAAVRRAIDAGNAQYRDAFLAMDAARLAEVYDPRGSRLNEGGQVRARTRGDRGGRRRVRVARGARARRPRDGAGLADRRHGVRDRCVVVHLSPERPAGAEDRRPLRHRLAPPSRTAGWKIWADMGVPGT